MRSTWTRVAQVAGLTASVVASGLVAGRPDDPEYYRSLKQAPFAPPAWVFGPAWLLAKAGWSWTTVRVLADRDLPGRRAYLWLAAVDTAVYVSFSYVYFRRRSPLLAAIWTAADAAVTAGEVAVVAKADRPTALGLLPQSAWLCLATPAAVYQAAANR